MTVEHIFSAHTVPASASASAPAQTGTIASPTQAAVLARADGARTLSHGLLAAGVAAWVVLADQWLGEWGDSHAVAAWLALWLVAVLAMVILRGAMRELAHRMMRQLNQRSAAHARRRADARLWAMAQSDRRLMQELRMAQDRHAAQAQ